MRTRSAEVRLALPLAAVIPALVVILTGGGCFPIPSIEEKVVELVTTSSTTAQFVAQGEINLHEDTVTINLGDSLDLPQLLEDAGIDASQLVSVSFGGAAYQVITPDPTPGREIVGGNITVQRAGDVVKPLIVDFNAPVVVTGYFQDLVPDSAGVAVINGVLADLVENAKFSTPVPNPELTFTVSGASHPLEEPSYFVWELRLYVSIVGTITLDLVSF